MTPELSRKIRVFKLWSFFIPGGKSSIHYSDTSSLLSHRFSTISISSNVSSEVSSSCYLASMSSADFDDRPGKIKEARRARWDTCQRFMTVYQEVEQLLPLLLSANYDLTRLGSIEQTLSSSKIRPFHGHYI